MDLAEGVGESSSPPRSFGSFSNYDVRNDVFNRLIEAGNEEAVCNPEFREQLDAHFNRFPASYGLDVNMDRVEDVLLHQKLLAVAKDPEKRPAYHIRFIENLCTRTDGNDDQLFVNSISTARPSLDADNEGIVPSQKRVRDSATDFEPCSKLEDLNLDRKNSIDIGERYAAENSSRSSWFRLDVKGHLGNLSGGILENPTLVGFSMSNQRISEFALVELQYAYGNLHPPRQELVPIHEVVFSTVDKPKLLSQLSALLSDIGLNIREAHVFSTTDGYSLDVFVVDGWPVEDTDGLYEAMEKAVARSEGSWSGSTNSRSAVEKAIESQTKSEDWEIDRRLLKTGERIASGSCGDLYRGVYLGQDVAVKVLRSEHLNDTLEDEFVQEVAILREVQHRNVVRFIEYMPGGSLYDYLHKNHNVLKLSQLLRFAIDICKGMEYLHQSNIIHRDLKTANLLMDTHNVVKVADFGVARFQNKGGVMTAETGTYRWMAPEVINHQLYDQKADVFSFAIVLWELVTAKGLRPDLPENAHPKLIDLMQRCWDAVSDNRPSFSEIKLELEVLLQEVQEPSGAVNGN
ncbi:hypothetical protein KPL71_016418 [Citrus sinensis]|uniref:Uncharacterized protein n=1 Tax=Citrus sinensis TaxID=2711 RepID=A0ACB8KT60_CITSI|nr:hypothetical protein KPL71_016418 [Citrus sinensis]